MSRGRLVGKSKWGSQILCGPQVGFPALGILTPFLFSFSLKEKPLFVNRSSKKGFFCVPAIKRGGVNKGRATKKKLLKLEKKNVATKFDVGTFF